MSLRIPASNVQPTRTMQPTSMATMLEAREKVFRDVTSPGMESPPARVAPPFRFLARLSRTPVTGCSLQQPGCWKELIQATIHIDRVLLYSSVRLQVPGYR